VIGTAPENNEIEADEATARSRFAAYLSVSPTVMSPR
jgi:hypothetical protein